MTFFCDRGGGGGIGDSSSWIGLSIRIVVVWIFPSHTLHCNIGELVIWISSLNDAGNDMNPKRETAVQPLAATPPTLPPTNTPGTLNHDLTSPLNMDMMR